MSRADTWTPLGWLWHLWYQPGTPGPIRQGHNRRDSSMDDGNRRKLRFWRRWPGVFLNQPQLTSDAEARPPRASAVSSLGEPPECRDGHMSKLSARTSVAGASGIDAGAWARRPPAVCQPLEV